MRWVLYGLLVIVILAALVVVIGLLLPSRHTVSRSVAVQAPPEKVWEVITDYENNPRWRTDLKSVTRVGDVEGRPVWREESKSGDVIPYETVESRAPHRLVRRIADPELPFGGTWTIEVSPERDGSRVRITENGEVRNPVYRFVSALIMGHTKFMDSYLTDLSRRFGAEARPS